MSSYKDKPVKDPRDLIERGNKSSSPLGTTIFVGLRLLDGFLLQRLLLTHNPLPAILSRFNLGSAIPLPPPPTGSSFFSFSSPPLTPFQTLIWAYSVGSALKQSVWILYTSKEFMPVSAAVVICLFNTALNGINTLAFTTYAAVNPTWSPELVVYVTLPVYVLGMFVETYSEFQRKWFKDDLPRNKGKPYAGGLFAYARSVNYFGYMLWRAAFAAAGGGWVWGLVVAGGFAWDFTQRAIPVMERYCEGRYGEGWEEVKRKVRYRFFPGVY